MEWIFNQLRERPELAIFLTIFLGFWLGKLRIGKFTLGTVTKCTACRRTGRATEYSRTGSDKVGIFSAFPFCRGL